jgi:putative FmdB family regulatory protein
MPTYSYKCEDCTTKYEVFHKVREIEESVICPECGSEKSKRLMTAAGISGFSSTSKSFDMPMAPTCAGGNCAGGMCSLN